MSDTQRKAVEAAVKSLAPDGRNSSNTASLESGAAAIDTVIKQLERLGFQREDIHQALKALEAGSEVIPSAVLDWLCIHLPEQQLPSSFTPGMLRYCMGNEMKIIQKRVEPSESILLNVCRQADVFDNDIAIHVCSVTVSFNAA